MEQKSFELAAMIFDFDGVILESTDIKTQAFVELFERYPEHRGAIVEYHRKHLGMSRYKKFAWIYEKLLEKPLTEEILEDLGARFSNLVFEKILRSPFVPGALETLERLQSLGIPAFVVSGTPQGELSRIIERRNLKRFFLQVWGSPNEKSAAIRNILASFRLRPTESLFLGDGFFDYQAAASEGVPFIARKSGAEDIDWNEWGVPCVADLTCFPEMGFDRPITISSSLERVSEISLAIKSAVPAKAQ